MSRPLRRLLYNGEINANVVGGFMRLGQNFLVIHPGYDSQGRRRTNWTQVVYDGVPVWEWKLSAPLDVVLEKFDEDFKTHIGKSPRVLAQSLRQCVAARRARFKDGVTGVEPAPGMQDRQHQGREIPA